MKRLKKVGIIAVVCLSLVACQGGVPKEALELSPESLQQRQTQTRRFDTNNEAKLLTSGAQVLQDLGFTVEDSETKLGMIAASKDRDATETGQVIGAVLLAILTKQAQAIDDKQKIRVSLITRPVSAKETLVRVTFQRVVWNTRGQVSKTEPLDDPKRSIQSRVFDTTDKAKTQRTIIATLQDLGFVIDKADATLGTVSATKLNGYAMRMTVSVRDHGTKQTLVRASAQYNQTAIEDPLPYQQFFTALEKAMFLTAHDAD